VNLKPGDRVLVKPLGVKGTVLRLRTDGLVVVLADCATQPVVWKLSEVSKLEFVGGVMLTEAEISAGVCVLEDLP
jgi:hypothetical protein